MVTRILQFPHPILTKVADPVSDIDEAKSIVKQLYNCAVGARWGRPLGLAAPQIGISKRMFIIGNQAFVNPEILEAGGSWVASEGCFSLKPNKFDYRVTRFEKIKLKWTDIFGQEHVDIFDGLQAQIASHEYDHLEGKLLISNGVRA